MSWILKKKKRWRSVSGITVASMAQEERALMVCVQVTPFKPVNFECFGLPPGQWSWRSSLVGKEFLSKDIEVALAFEYTSESITYGINLFTDGHSDGVLYDDADSLSPEPPRPKGSNP